MIYSVKANIFYRILFKSDRGSVTVEGAFGIISLLSVLIFCLYALVGMTEHVRCIDLSRELARLTARSDFSAVEKIKKNFPINYAQLAISDEQGLIRVKVTYKVTWFLNLDLGAESVAFKESELSSDL